MSDRLFEFSSHPSAAESYFFSPNAQNTQNLPDLQNPKSDSLTQQHWEDRESDLLGRIIVTAGIFLLLFLTGRFLKEPSQETVQAWISSNSAYEKAIEQTTDWIEQQWEFK